MIIQPNEIQERNTGIWPLKSFKPLKKYWTSFGHSHSFYELWRAPADNIKAKHKNSYGFDPWLSSHSWMANMMLSTTRWNVCLSEDRVPLIQWVHLHLPHMNCHNLRVYPMFKYRDLLLYSNLQYSSIISYKIRLHPIEYNPPTRIFRPNNPRSRLPTHSSSSWKATSGKIVKKTIDSIWFYDQLSYEWRTKLLENPKSTPYYFSLALILSLVQFIFV